MKSQSQFDGLFTATFAVVNTVDRAMFIVAAMQLRRNQRATGGQPPPQKRY